MTFVYQGTTSQQALAAQAVAACDYPFDRLTHDVTIAWRDLTSDRALGLYWPGRYLIEIHTGLEGQPLLAQQVALAELWHAVDDQTVTEEQRQRIGAAWHDSPDGHQWFPDDNNYNAWLGESMMFGFSLAFAPSLGVSGLERQFVHRTTPDLAAKVRAILLGAPERPARDTALIAAMDPWADRIRGKWGRAAKAKAAYLTWRDTP